MISNAIYSQRVPNYQYEQSFLNQFKSSYIQFAIEVDDPKNMPDILSKIKNATTGLYIRTDGFNILSNSKNQSTITIHKIPKEINSLSACCDWIFKEHTPNTNSSLASIACDDTRIVVNSNQSITNTDYFVNLLKNLQNSPYDKFFTRKSPIPVSFNKDIIKEEYDEYVENKEHHMKDSSAFQPSDLTFLNLHNHYTAKCDFNQNQNLCKTVIKCSDLSPFIYDRYMHKVRKIYDFMWTGLCMAINASNGEFGPFGIANCIDFRKIHTNGKLINSFGNTNYTSFSLCVQDVNPKMTIGEICSLFRANFDLINTNDQFYKDCMLPLEYNHDDCAVSHFSNVGPMVIKSHPYKDFYMQNSEMEDGLPPLLNVSCYSKRKKDNGMDNFVIQMRYSPSVLKKENADKVFGTYVYFLKNVNPSMKSGDVLNELIQILILIFFIFM